MAKAKTETKAATKTRRGRHEIVLDGILRLEKNISDSYLDLSVLVQEAYNNDHAVKFNLEGGFEEYVKTYMGMSYRKAMYLIEIRTKLEELGIPEEKAKDIGWTKMKELVRVIDETNWEEWFEKAAEEGVSVAVLSDLVKEELGVSSGSGENGASSHLLKLKMAGEEYSIVLDALAAAKQVNGLDNDVSALVTICQDWETTSGVGGDTVTLEQHVANLEKRFKVSLSWDEKDDLPVVETAAEEEVGEEEGEEKPAPKKKAAPKKAEKKKAAPKKAKVEEAEEEDGGDDLDDLIGGEDEEEELPGDDGEEDGGDDGPITEDELSDLIG